MANTDLIQMEVIYNWERTPESYDKPGWEPLDEGDTTLESCTIELRVSSDWDNLPAINSFARLTADGKPVPGEWRQYPNLRIIDGVFYWTLRTVLSPEAYAEADALIRIGKGFQLHPA